MNGNNDHGSNGDRPIIDAQEVQRAGVPVEPIPIQNLDAHDTGKDNHSSGYAHTEHDATAINRRSPIVIYSLLGILVMAFIAQAAVGGITWNMVPSRMGGNDAWSNISQWPVTVMTMLIMGALHRMLVASGEYWRLLTSIFLHASLMHLFMNGFGLYVWGRHIEMLFGRVRTLALFIISGLGGALISYALGRSNSWSLGASGALFGLFGTLLYFRKRRPVIFKRAFGPQVIAIIVINLAYGLLNQGIDNYGHIGGLIFGYIGAWAIGLYKEKHGARLWAWGVLAGLTIACLYIGWKRFASI